jgi:hypothetical protein
MRHTLTVTLLLTLTACGGGNVPQDAQKTADVLSGDAKGAAADNPMCKLFTPAELEAYAGEPLNAGANAGMGTGCQWTAKDGEGDVMVVAVPSNYAEVPSLAEGFRDLPELGEKGFTAPEMGGWVAGAIVGKEFVKVSVAGAKASADNAIALFRETVKRRPAS